MKRLKTIWAAVSRSATSAPTDPSQQETEGTKKADESAPEKPEAAPSTKQPPPSAAYVRAWKSYQNTASWIIGVFASILIAAIGTSPFLVLDEIDSPVEGAWAVWGLLLATGGASAVIWAASDMRAPGTAAVGQLLAPRGIEPTTDEARETRRHIKANRDALAVLAQSELPDIEPKRWAQTNGPNEQLVWNMRRELELDDLTDQLLKAHESGADDDVIANLKARQAIIQAMIDDGERLVDGWQGRLLLTEIRLRFERIRPTLFAGAIFTAVGLVAFLGSSRIDAQPASTSPEPTRAALLLDDASLASELVAQTGACDGSEVLAVTLDGGTGTDDDPWRVSSDEGPCGRFVLSVSRSQAALIQVIAPEATAQVRLLEDDLAAAMRSFGGTCDPEALEVSVTAGRGTSEDPWRVITIDDGCPTTELRLTSDEAVLFGVAEVRGSTSAPADEWFDRIAERGVLADLVGSGFVVGAVGLLFLFLSLGTRWPGGAQASVFVLVVGMGLTAVALVA